MSNARLFIFTLSIQIAAVAVFGALAIFLLGLERVILGPIPYLALLWATVTPLNAIALLLLFRHHENRAETPRSPQL